MIDKKKIKDAVAKLKPKDPRVVAIRAMIALAKSQKNPAPAGVDGAAGRDGVDGAAGRDGVDGRDGQKGLDGVAGARGEVGEKGEIGLRGERGEAGMIWRGTYRSDTQYEIGDVVGVSGSAYICVANTNQSPPIGYGWELLVSRGAQGVRGIKGEDGTGGGGAAAAGTLTGDTLAANVVSSSLTSVGTLTSITTSGVITGTNTTASTSSTTGAVIIAGGVGIANDSFINGMRIGVGGTGLGIDATNTALGVNALTNNTGIDCTAVGNQVLNGNTAANCTAVGSGAMLSNTGADGTAVGYAALTANIGGECTAIGKEALALNTGNTCLGIGNLTLYANTGSGCTAVGNQVLQNNTGSNNTGIGKRVMFQSPSGENNTAGGVTSLSACQSGSNNTAWGASSLELLSTGSSNVAIGSTAGFSIETGSDNTIIGAGATVTAENDINSIVIGKDAVGTGSNSTVIGTSSTTAAKVFGALSIPSVTIDAGTATVAPLKLTSGTNLTTASSGAVEFDGKVVYATTATGRGVVPSVQMIVPSSVNSLTNTGGVLQDIFSSSQNLVTLQANTTYMFDSVVYLTEGTTSHSTSYGLTLDGGATASSFVLRSTGFAGASFGAAVTAQITVVSDDPSAGGWTGNTTSTSPSRCVKFEGVIRVVDGGTMTPQLVFSVAPGGTNQVEVGTFFRIYAIGTDTMQTVGAIS